MTNTNPILLRIMSEKIDPLWELNIRIPGQRHCRLALDHIEKAGNISITKLIQWTAAAQIAWANIALRTIIDNEIFRENVLERDVKVTQFRSRNNSNDKADIELLEKWGVLELLEDRAQIHAFANFFKVPKNSSLARAIIDCRESNSICKPPPTVNLPDITEVIQRISDLGPAFYVTADLRHWFYQCPICPAFAQTAIIQCGRNRYRPKVLPMGHSWSAFFAQTLCWCFALFTHHDDNDLGVNLEEFTSLPKFINLRTNSGAIVGFLTIWYDNILIASTDRGLAHRWLERLRRNSQGKVLDATLKESKIWLEGKVSHLGVDFEISSEQRRWRWNHQAKQKCIERFSAMTEFTPRNIAELAGKGLWQSRISLEPLFKAMNPITLAKIAADTAKEDDWDKPFEPDLKLIETTLNEISTREWFYNVEWTPSGKIHFIATDASPEYGLGITRLWSDTTTTNESIQYRGDIIVTSEAAALLTAIEETPCSAGDILRIAVDNTALIGAVIKGYSPSDRLNEMTKRIWQHIQTQGVRLELRWIS